MSKVINMWEWYYNNHNFTIEQIQTLNKETSRILAQLKEYKI